MSFLRNSSGLVKKFKWYDAFLINFASIGPLADISYPLFLASYLPNASWIFSILFSAVLMTPLLVNYYLLSLHVSRSAGDYVYVSRALGGRFGTIQGVSLLMSMFTASATISYLQVIFWLVPSLQIIGVSLHLQSLVNLGFTILNSPLYSFLATAVFILLVYTLAPHKNSLRVLTILQFVSLAIIIAGLALFRSSFTQYASYVTATHNMTQTLVLASVFALSAFMFVNAPSYIAGEFKNTRKSFLAGYYLVYPVTVVLMLIVTVLLEMDLGKAGYINVTLHGLHVPIVTTSLLSIASVPFLNMPVLEFVLIAGSIGWFLLFVLIDFISAPRIMLSMALDRILPAKFADVSDGNPAFARRFQLLVVILLALLEVYYGLAVSYIAVSYLFMAWNFLIVAIASLKMSHVDRKLVVVGGLSIITQLFVMMLTLVYALTTPFGEPLFAGNVTFDLVYIVLPPLLGLVIYEVTRRRNPEVELLFKQIPPE